MNENNLLTQYVSSFLLEVKMNGVLQMLFDKGFTSSGELKNWRAES